MRKSQQTGGTWERGDLESMKVVELKEICKTLGLFRTVLSPCLPV